MEINDLIYGKELVREPVLIELINSPPMQRLKKVSQFGIPEKYSRKEGFSRYEHSVGVLILLKRLGADLEEQIAGLLHDVSHTAFSHLIDWVIGDPTKDDYQDKTLLKVFEETEIREILECYGFNYKKIAQIENYSLLEQEPPSLCADRVDYALREIALLHSREDSLGILRALGVSDGRIVFNFLQPAKLFAEYYTLMNRDHWSGGHTKARFHIFSNVLKKALNENILSFDDLMKTDLEILNVLEGSDNEKIADGLNLLKKGFLLKKSEDGDGVVLRKKFRYIDPEIIVKDEIIRLSDSSEEYKNLLNKEREDSLKNHRVLIIPLK